MISVQVHEGTGGLLAHEAAWEALAAQMNFASVFASPAWCQAWLDVYPVTRIALLTATAGGRLVGVLPVVRYRTDARGLYLTRVSPPAPAITDYQCPVVLPEYAEEALPLLWDAQIRHFGGGVHWWPNLPERDGGLRILRDYLARKSMPVFEESENAPFLSFEGKTYEEVLQGLSGHLRRDIRRRRKKLEEHGPVSVWLPSTVEEAAPVLEEFFQVHDQKWLEQGYPGVFTNEATRRFFHAIVRRLFGKGVHFSTLRCGDTHVSYHFGFQSNGWLMSYRPTYRPQFHAGSPTKVHLSLLIEQAHASGGKGFDFLLGEEGYKLEWASGKNRVVSIHSAKSQYSPAYLWFSAGKPWLRDRGSSALVRWKARWQRWRRPGAAPPQGSSDSDSVLPSSIPGA